QGAPLRVVGEHLVQQLGRAREVLTRAFEQVEELLVGAAQEVRDRAHRTPGSIRPGRQGRPAFLQTDRLNCSRVRPSSCSSPATRTPSSLTGRVGANRLSRSSATGTTSSVAATG